MPTLVLWWQKTMRVFYVLYSNVFTHLLHPHVPFFTIFRGLLYSRFRACARMMKNILRIWKKVRVLYGVPSDTLVFCR